MKLSIATITLAAVAFGNASATTTSKGGSSQKLVGLSTTSQSSTAKSTSSQSQTTKKGLLVCPTIYQPVQCGTKTKFARYPNDCEAERDGYSTTQCWADEQEDIMDFMDKEFGAKNCDVITPGVTNNKDAEVWYKCNDKTRNFEATLFSKGLQPFPRPDQFEVNGQLFTLRNKGSDLKDVKSFYKSELTRSQESCPTVWAPVHCGKNDEWFSNDCFAETDGGYLPSKDCVCDERKDIRQYLFGMTRNCEVVTPYPAEGEKPLVLDICKMKDGSEVTLASTGLEDYNPRVMDISITYKNGKTAISGLQNDCHDLDAVEAFLKGTARKLTSWEPVDEDCTYEWAPVICGKTSEWFANECAALMDGYTSNDCTCDEHDDIIHAMNFKFGEENCGYKWSPAPAKGAKTYDVVYTCKKNKKTSAEFTSTSSMIGHHPVAKSLVVMKGVSVIGHIFENDCTDLVDAERFLKTYN
ncbi:MAG: hypothetical protein SGILL_006177 [Bacillariaceae sp.]